MKVGITEHLDNDDTDALDFIEADRKKHTLPAAPAMPVQRVYDERVLQRQNSTIVSIGFASLSGSYFRTYDSNGKYKHFDIMMEGTSATHILGATVSQLVPEKGSPSGVAPEPIHFRHHQDTWDSKTQQHLPNGDVVDEWIAMVHLPIPMKKALTIPKAKAAMGKEWDALASLPA